jgi:mono/diheme cytochrome c family protein
LPSGKLKKFTAASGSMVYRGDQLPEKFYGMVLTPEPAGNLISARHLIEKEGSLGGKEIYDKQEILTSTDERFRPVNMYTAPDGSIYFLDLYHGILQHRVFVTSYLRKQMVSRGLDKNNNDRGRIYRLRSTAKALGTQPKLSGLSAKELVPYLAHANGWWRDTARQLIIQKNDKSVVSSINSLIVKTKDHRSVINALWTLEGLSAISLSSVKAGLAKSHAKAKISALAVAEFLPVGDHQAMAMILAEEVKSADYEMALQIALVAGTIKDPSSLQTLKVILDKFKDKKFINEAAISSLTGREKEFMAIAATLKSKKFAGMLAKVGKSSGKVKTNYNKLSKADKKLFDHGKKLFFGHANCFGCHGPDAEGLPNMGPPLVKSEWVTGSKELLAKVMLHGLYGPITVNKKKYNVPMPMPGLGANPMFKNKDIASIATFIRNYFGNKASAVQEADIAKVRAATKTQAGPYKPTDLLKN